VRKPGAFGNGSHDATGRDCDRIRGCGADWGNPNREQYWEGDYRSAARKRCDRTARKSGKQKESDGEKI
jgi:hypothetical protein